MPTVNGIDYTSQGGYNTLDFAALVNQFGGGYTTPAGSGPRLGLIGKRHVAVDVFGKVLMMRGVMRATNSDGKALGGGQQAGRTLSGNLNTKYGGTPGWRDATGARLRHMHLNMVGNTSDAFNLGGGMMVLSRNNLMSEAMRKVRMDAVFGVGVKEPIKDLMTATKQGAVGIVGREFGDVFDPKYTQYVNAPNSWTVWDDPKIFAFWADDGDHVSAFGGMGHPNEVDGVQDVNSGYGMHAGMAILWGRLTGIESQNNPNPGPQTWSTDTLNHTKTALINYLKTKYSNSISALNTAWGTGGYYTSFDTVSGWGNNSTGLADEAGSFARAWFGPPASVQQGGVNNIMDSTAWGLAGTLVTSSFGLGQVRALKEDLDVMMFKVYEAFLKPIYDRIKAVRANALFAGSNGGAPQRAPGLAALNLYTDCSMLGGHFAAGNSHVLNPHALARTNWIRRFYLKPMFTSYYTGVNWDSCLYYYPVTDNGERQSINGKNYSDCLQGAINYQDVNGFYPYIGGLKWGLYDQPSTSLTVSSEGGWGLFSYNDNPYDGRDYRVAGSDPYNAVTGQTRTTWAEDKIYGDQLGYAGGATPVTPERVVTANMAVFTLIQQQFSGEAQDPDVTPPTAPGVVTAPVINANSMQLQWGAATDTPPGQVARYRVKMRTGAAAFVEVAAPTGTNVLVTGLAPLTLYDFQVFAEDTASPTPNLSATSANASFTTSAGAPAGTESFDGPDSTTSVAFDQPWTALGTAGLGKQTGRAAVTLLGETRRNARMDVDAATVEQFVEDDLLTLTATGDYADFGICLRHSAVADTKYALVATNSKTFGTAYCIWKIVAGVATLLVVLPNGPSPGPLERRRLECRTVGGNAELTAFIRGVQNGAVFVDASNPILAGLRSGLTGMAVTTGDAASVDNFAFGVLTGTPVPTDPPVVTITAPTEAATVVGVVTVTATVQDLSGSLIASTRLYVDTVQVSTEPLATEFQVDTTQLTNVSHTFRVEATDNAGNTGTSALRTVTVDNPVAVTTRKLQVSYLAFKGPDAPVTGGDFWEADLDWDREDNATAYEVSQNDQLVATLQQTAVGVRPAYTAHAPGTSPSVDYKVVAIFAGPSGPIQGPPMVVTRRHRRPTAVTGFRILAERYTP